MVMTRIVGWISKPLNLMLMSFAALMSVFGAIAVQTSDANLLVVPIAALGAVIVALINKQP